MRGPGRAHLSAARSRYCNPEQAGGSGGTENAAIIGFPVQATSCTRTVLARTIFRRSPLAISSTLVFNAFQSTSGVLESIRNWTDVSSCVFRLTGDTKNAVK